ncbi:MAG TPA: hypothetical protein VFC78_03125 [Tepidisphaeraceae bacterium]|nr:hypothetical protein [Tepidisphaeraceae bacterium]
MQTPFSKHDETAIMQALGPIIPSVLREAVEEGWHRFKKSRSLDPNGFAEYGLTSRANMLYDRIAAAARDLVGVAAVDIPGLSCGINKNKKSTEVTFEPYFAFRMKRTKRNRKGLTTSVNTWRQCRIKSEYWTIRQPMLFPQIPISMEDRLWMTIGFDLDDLEEQIDKVEIGVEARRKFIWKQPLIQADAEVIASFPAIVADRIAEMRVRRSA